MLVILEGVHQGVPPAFPASNDPSEPTSQMTPPAGGAGKKVDNRLCVDARLLRFAAILNLSHERRRLSLKQRMQVLPHNPRHEWISIGLSQHGNQDTFKI